MIMNGWHPKCTLYNYDNGGRELFMEVNSGLQSVIDTQECSIHTTAAYKLPNLKVKKMET